MKCLALVACIAVAGTALGDESAPDATLDSFHRAAAGADTAAYFAAMTDDVVFLGTDGTERWQGSEFRDFAAAHFDAGRGWTYVPVQRDISISANGDVAWFDELLQNEGLGTCRGSGVMVKSENGWKIAQYNLSVPIPNAIVQAVATDIAALQSAPNTLDQAVPAATAGTASLTATEAPVADPEPAEAASRDGCAKKRFKTNRKAGC
jgi:ketosteroid isomerase-like protein